MLRIVLENPWVRAVGALLAAALLCLLAYALKPVLVPLFLALIAAYVLDPVVDFFEARRIPRMISIVGLACAGLLLLLSLPMIIVPSVFHQASQLIASARGVYTFAEVDTNNNGVVSPNELIATRGFDENDIFVFDTNHDGTISKEEWDAALTAAAPAKDNTLLDRLLDYLPVTRLVQMLDLEDQGTIASSAAATTETEPTSSSISPRNFPAHTAGPANEDVNRERHARELLAEYIGKNVRDFTVQFVKTHAASLATFGQRAGLNIFGFVTSVGQGLVKFLLFLANFALFAIVAGYLLKDFDPLKATARDLVPPRYKPKTLSILGKIDDQLRSFLRGQMTVCLCLGVMYTAGFLICDVPFAIPVGMFSIVAAFIPFVGVATTAILGILLTLLQHGIGWNLLGVLIVVAGVQFFEGNVLTPKIVGEKVGLNPVWVILAIMVFGNFLGFLGLLLAVPTAAALKVLVLESVAYYKASPVFAECEEEGSEAPEDEAPPRNTKRR